MIVFNDKDEVIAYGAIFMTDVIRLCTYIKPFRKKLLIKLRKEEKIAYHTNYPFEVYYMTRIFNTFIKMMLNDVLFNNVLYKHNAYKCLYLAKENNTKVVKYYCRKYSAIPNMPVYKVMLKMKYKGGYKYRNLTLYNELLVKFKEKMFNGELSEGIKETKNVDSYLKTLLQRFPSVDKKIIRKVIQDGMQLLWMPVKGKKTDVIVSDLHGSKNRICAVLNTNSYSEMLPHYQSLVKFLGKYKDDNFYAVFTDEEQAKIEAGEKEVSGLTIYTLAFVKLFVKGFKRRRYKHIYKIMRTDRSNYKYYIQRTNVKTSRLKYLYRRFNERYKPVDNA